LDSEHAAAIDGDAALGLTADDGQCRAVADRGHGEFLWWWARGTESLRSDTVAKLPLTTDFRKTVAMFFALRCRAATMRDKPPSARQLGLLAPLPTAFSESAPLLR
jgi:hypothetical protein